MGALIESVEVLHPRPVRRHLAGPADFASVLTGRTIVGARRRGKYLWLPLAPTDASDSGQGPGDALMAHLGMSGQLLVQPAGVPDERHLRVRFRLDRGDRELRFVDQRMFGGLSLSPGGAEVPAEIAHIAPDPLEAAFDESAFVSRVRRSHSGVKRLLLTQTVISGVGNIYADEALWRSGLHGERPGSQLTRAQVLELLGHVRAVMTDALAQGGTSFDALYVNVNG